MYTSKINLIKNIFIKGAPCYLTFFVTTRCFANCKHCFVRKKHTPGQKELILSEINQISSNMGRLHFLLLTGGEPFLRKDIADIAEIFYRQNKVRIMAMPTNGFLSKNIYEAASAILSRCKDITLTINISLDGLGQKHDEIRGKKGLFEALLKTYALLCELKEKHKNFNIGFITTVSTLNQDELPAIYDFVRNELKAKIWSPFLIRGNVEDNAIKPVNIAKYEEISKQMEADIMNNIYKETFYGSILAGLNSAKNVLRRRIIASIYKKQKYVMPCFAGRLITVLYSNGDLYSCELRDEKIGNLRECNYDFNSLLFSPGGGEIRELIKRSKCFCTHECVLTVNIMFNLKYYFSLLKILFCSRKKAWQS